MPRWRSYAAKVAPVAHAEPDVPSVAPSAVQPPSEVQRVQPPPATPGGHDALLAVSSRTCVRR